MSGGVATVGRLAVSITGDVDGLKTSMAEAQSVVGAAAKDIAANVSAVSDETDKVTAAGKRMVAALQEEVRTFGMSREEILVYKASLTGAGAEVERLVGQVQALKAAQSAAPQLRADAEATQRIKDMVAASLAQSAAMNVAAGAAQNLTSAETGAARVTASWAESQRLQAQNMAGVTASMKSASEGTAALSAQTQLILNRYDPLGTKLRSLQSDMAILRKEMGNSVDPAAIKAFQGLEDEISKTHALMTKAGVDGFGTIEEGAKKGAWATAGATRELMVLGHEAMSGNFAKIPGSLMILVDRLGLTSAMLSPMTLGMVGLGVASLTVAGAMLKGHDEMVAMNNAMLVTSDYAGASRQSMDRLAESMTQTHEITIGTANAIVLALVSSGRIGGESIAQISRFISDFAKSTGQSIDEIAPKMISLFEDPTRGAQELNSSMHFLTTTQIEHIAALERTGQVQAAQAELAKAASDHMPKQAENIGFITAALLEQRDAWSKLGAAIRAWGAERNQPDQKAQDLRDQISEYLASGLTRQNPAVKVIQAQLDALEPAILKQKELTQAQKDAAAANELQAKSWDAVKASSTAYHIQELRDRLKLIEAHKSEAGPDFAAQEEAKRDAIRKTNDEIDAAQRAIGAEARELTQQRVTDQEQLDLLKLKGAASAIDTQYKLGKITKEQFDMNMTNNSLEENEVKQIYERRMANVSGLATAERQAHLDKLKLLKEEASQIEQKGAAAIDIDDKKMYDEIINATINAGTTAIKSLDEQIAKQREHNAEIGKSKEQIELAKQAQVDLATTQLQSDADYLRDGLAKWELDDAARAAYEIRLSQLDAEIERRRTLGLLHADGAVREADAKAAADAAAAWKKSANTIENDLTNAILDGGGKGWKKLVRDMEMAFAKMVLQPILEPISGGLATTLSPFMGNQTITGAGGGAIGLAQTASNLYSTVAGGMTATGGIGSGFMGSLQGGLLGAGAGSGLTSSVGLSIGNSIAGVVGPSVSGAIASGLGAVATALPWIGAAVAAVAIGKAAFGMGPKETTAMGISGTLSDSGVTGQSYTDWKKKGGWFRSDQHGQDTSALSGDLVKQFTQGLSSLEASAAGFASSLGVSADAINGYSKAFDITLTGDATKDQAAITAFFTGVGDEIANRLVPDLAEFEKSGESAAAALQRLAGDFKVTDQVAQLIGKTSAATFGAVGIASAKAREQLINLAGGASVLSQQASNYAQNFLTDAQKLAPVQKALNAAMASLGLSGVQTRQQFKDVVDSLDLTTEAGAKEFTSLMALADAFAQVHPAVEATVDALAQVNKGYQDQIDALLKATMSADEVRALETAGMDASTVALYDRLHALQAEANAAAIDKQHVQAAAQERKSLQDQLDQLTMTSAQLLDKQRNALDESNRALFDQVQAASAAKDAMTTAAAAIKAAQQSAAASMKSVGDSVASSMTNATAAAKALRDFNDSLLLGNLSPLNADEKYRAAKSQYETNPYDTQAAQAFLQASKDRGADDFYYQQDFAKVQANIAAGASAKDSFAASIPAFWKSLQEMATPSLPVSVAPVVATGTMSGSSTDYVGNPTPTPSSTKTLEAKVDNMSATLQAALKTIADSTAKTADIMDRVTSGGTAMVNA